MRPEVRASYDLCLYLGVIHPDYLLGALTSRQWAGWLTYLRLYPLPHDRADLNTAMIRATAMSCAGAKHVQPAKLIPAYGKVTQRKTGRELKEITDAWAARKKR